MVFCHVKRLVLFGLTAVFAVALAVGGSARADERLSVVATTGMIADAVAEVGGDLVDVRSLMGPGVDPHAYRQTRSDIVRMTKADAVLWHGLYLEAQMESFFGDLAQKTPVFAVAESLPKELLLSHDDYADRHDPHVWMNPILWTLVVDEVARILGELRPDQAAYFVDQAADYKSDLLALDAYSIDRLASVPATSRVLITAHDAFKYFGEAYDFRVLGVQGISTESEAGLQRIAELVDVLVDNDIQAVFVESSVSDRSVRALIEGARNRGHTVAIGGELFSDAMGQGGTYLGTYLGMIDHNVTLISNALGGQAPLAGRLGRLDAGS